MEIHASTHMDFCLKLEMFVLSTLMTGNVLPRFLLNYKVCKVTVMSADFEESTRETVLKINQDRACKIGVLSSALPKVFALTLNKSSLHPFYLPTLKSSACSRSPLLRCQQGSRWGCAPRRVKSQTEPRPVLPTSPKKSRETGTLTQPHHLNT